MAKKYLSLERLYEYDALLKSKIDEGDKSSLSSAKSYTDTKVSGITGGTIVVKEAEHAGTANNASHASTADTATNATNATNASNAEKFGGQLPSYYAKASDIPTGALAKKSSVSESDLDSALAEKVNAAAEGNHSHSNKAVLDGITSAKVSAWDSAEGNAKSYSDGNLLTAKSYTDGKISALLDGASDTTLDSIKELADAIKENDSAIDALNGIASGKADATHNHAIADVTGLQDELDGKAAASHGTHVSFDSTNKPKMDGTAAFGTSSKVARADHIHPTDTSRASKTEFDTHVTDTTKHIASTERTNWGTAYTHSQAAHAPSNAEKNQNAFSNVKVGETTIVADTATDTLTFVGSNVTITPDATNDQITIAVATGSTSTAGILKLTNSTSSTSTTTAATPSSVKSAYDLANQAKTAAATAQSTADGKADASHTHTVANITDLTATATELNYMDGVTSGVQAQLDGKAAASHGNHVPATQTASNKVFLRNDNTWATVTPANIGAAASSHSHAISDITNLQTTLNNASSAISANTSSISGHTTRIEALETKVGDGFEEITSTEISDLFK